MNTFLEVSGRQVGKTHDLLKVAAEHIRKGGTAVIVVGEGMVEMVGDMSPDSMVIGYGQHTDDAMLERIAEMPNVRWFFDEFDWYKEVPVIPGGYYCTTPRFIRRAAADPSGDTLLTLVRELGEPTCQRACPHELEDFYPEAERDLLLRGRYLVQAA